MPFEEIETITKKNAMARATISYLLGAPWSRGSARPGIKPKLIISIPTTICGTSKATHFRLLAGTGEHDGILRIRGGQGLSDNGVEPSQHANFFRFNFGFVPRLGEDRFGPDKHPIRKISDEEFEITIPKGWFSESVPGSCTFGTPSEDAVTDIPAFPLKSARKAV